MSRFSIKTSLGASSALATLLLLQSGAAFAETPETNAETTAASSLDQEEAGELKIETVVIMARKREENLQDVPITVSAISGATLAAERLGVPHKPPAGGRRFVHAAAPGVLRAAGARRRVAPSGCGRHNAPRAFEPSLLPFHAGPDHRLRLPA